MASLVDPLTLLVCSYSSSLFTMHTHAFHLLNKFIYIRYDLRSLLICEVKPYMASLSLTSSSFSTVSTLHGGYSKGNSISCKARRTCLNVNGKKETNLYKVLSLDDSETVGVDEIKKAYRSMARRYHPDVCPSSNKEEYTRLFVELHQAYETLSDPALRALYDKGLRVNETVPQKFWKERWEAQLCGLRLRSEKRQRKMASN
ncbi:putative DnaJ domain, Chaperone J-domain superfamily [Dioscorea sansibarensis]